MAFLSSCHWWVNAAIVFALSSDVNVLSCDAPDVQPTFRKNSVRRHQPQAALSLPRTPCECRVVRPRAQQWRRHWHWHSAVPRRKSGASDGSSSLLRFGFVLYLVRDPPRGFRSVVLFAIPFSARPHWHIRPPISSGVVRGCSVRWRTVVS